MSSPAIADSAGAARPGPAAVTGATQDVRFAVAMSGGVSLAVWMGGVAREINLLQQASNMRLHGPAAGPDGSAAGPGTPGTALGAAGVPAAAAADPDLPGSTDWDGRSRDLYLRLLG